VSEFSVTYDQFELSRPFFQGLCVGYVCYWTECLRYVTKGRSIADEVRYICTNRSWVRSELVKSFGFLNLCSPCFFFGGQSRGSSAAWRLLLVVSSSDCLSSSMQVEVSE
jgi:hypothetical protein